VTSVQLASIEQAFKNLRQKFPQFWNADYQPNAKESDAYGEYRLLQKARSEIIKRITKRVTRDFNRDILPRLRYSADLFAKKAKQEKKRDHPVRAAICAAIASRFNPDDKTLKEIVQSLGEANELASWLPPQTRFRTWGSDDRRAFLTVFVQKQDLTVAQKQFILDPGNGGRPATGTTREVAAEALELHKKGGSCRSWRKIEEKLLPRRNYQKPGQAVRSEVQHLNRALSRFRISV
jgi:hypothetical protein